MDTFYNKLKKYIFKNKEQISLGLAPHFKFNDTTIIDSEVATEIYSNYEYLNLIKELFDKEKDYNRLLRKENQELTNELDSVYNNCEDEVDSNSDSNKGNYVS